MFKRVLPAMMFAAALLVSMFAFAGTVQASLSMSGDLPSTIPKGVIGQMSGVPVAVDDVVLLEQGTSVVVPVLLNDSDPNGDVLSVVAVSQPLMGC